MCTQAAEWCLLTLTTFTRAVTIDASKDGVKFACTGDIGNGAVTLRSHQNVEKPELNIEIELSEPVSLTFSLKYLVNFCKASALSSQVKICLSNEVPLLVEYAVQGTSWLRFYLAPKVGSFHISMSTAGLARQTFTGLAADFCACRLVTRSKRPSARCDLLHALIERLFHDQACNWFTRWDEAIMGLTGYIYYAEKM